MASTAQSLVLRGVVRYTLKSSDEIEAKWMSSRMVDRFSEAGMGKAKRIQGVEDVGAEGWEGIWDISYLEPDGKLALTPFILRLKKDGEAFHGTWALPESPDKPILTGFGFEDDSKLCMVYGS